MIEEHFRIPSPREGLSLFLRHLPPAPPVSGAPKVVLYVHGATFPSALSIGHRFDGRSWADDLAEAGFHVWGLDFLGFGNSDRYPEMAEPAGDHSPLGRADIASQQIGHAMRFICERHGIGRVSIIAHSWGTMAAGLFASQRPERVERLVLFGPVTWRARRSDPPKIPAWRDLSLQQQWDRFIEDVPPGVPQPLARKDFDEWGSIYLDSDADSRSRSPAGVRVPNGPMQDIAAAWSGELAYDPRLIRAPVAILRGEWDSVVNDADARWLFLSLEASPIKRDVKLSRGTHLMHLESGRFELHREARCFLEEKDTYNR
ncbi:MAG TPA: alpha/beta fold hydrolase [Usitatibacter sp.]|nr:alpha/beta fold hydrolase [Usitatibacter sp.]